MDNFSKFVYQKRGNLKIWADPGFFRRCNLQPFADPDIFFERTDCRVVKDQIKVKVGRVAVDIDQVATGVFVKRYNSHSLRYRITSLFCRSAARRALQGASLLSGAGIATPRPLAVIESRRFGALEKSFFITEEISNGKTADAYWRENLAPLDDVEGGRRRRRFLNALALLFRRLHRSRVYHDDLKDANILVDGSRSNERIFLLDLEGVRRRWRVSRRRRVKNLVQLNRTLGKYLSRTHKLHLLKAYLGGPFQDKNVRRRWIREIHRGTARADFKSRTKAPPEALARARN